MKWENDSEDRIMSTLAKAAAAVRKAAGLDKLKECVEGLELSQNFDINQKPREFSDDNKLLKFLGCPVVGSSTAQLITEGWRSYCEEWVDIRSKLPTDVDGNCIPLSPCEVYMMWKSRSLSLSDADRALAKIAMRNFSRPISSASCERVFSYLEHMNSSDRSNMSKETLRTVLFLRGNWDTLSEIVEEFEAARVEDLVTAREAQRTKAQRDMVREQRGDASKVPPQQHVAASSGKRKARAPEPMLNEDKLAKKARKAEEAAKKAAEQAAEEEKKEMERLQRLASELDNEGEELEILMCELDD